MTQCCNMHLWCGGSSSYICALRMGGGRINLGLVLVKGSLKGYSVQRDLEQSSNDRGAFFLHPEDMHIRPGESVQVEWELFWFEDRADFRKKLASCPGFVQVEAERFLLFEGEKVHFRAFIGQAVPEENGGGTGGNDAGAPAAGNGADALAGRNDADVRGSGSGARPFSGAARDLGAGRAPLPVYCRKAAVPG